MEIDLALLADAATLDATGKLSILGVFDRITAVQFPVQHGRIALVLRFTAGTSEIGTHDMEIRLSDPDGAELLKLNGEMRLGAGPSGLGPIRLPHILNLDGLVFARSGQYSFDIKVDGEHQRSISLFVEGPTTSHGAQA